MNKNKKILMVSITILVVIALVIVMAVEMGKAHKTSDNTTTKEEKTVNNITTMAEDITTSKDVDVKLDDIETTGKKSKKKKDDDYWKKVQVIEDANENESRTEKNGEVATKKDGSVDDGWSPVVSPDDLEK